MADGTLHDSLVTASSYFNSTHSPRAARPNPYDHRGTGWVPGISDVNQWIQVDFLQDRIVHTIVTQGCASGEGWVTSYTVEYSINDVGFVKLLEDGNKDKVGDALYVMP